MKLKRIGTARRRAVSSCNAFAIATFSSVFVLYDDDDDDEDDDEDDDSVDNDDE